MVRIFIAVTTLISTRVAALREDDRGMTTETVIITGALALAAIGALALIGAAINARATDSSNTIENGLGALGLL